ncbi:small ribosomal subunit protein eS21 isoform X1 [Callorhinus ursinus]|uniref:Small ribosomal subunit protein eS21 n=1 Tax=Callorhinus ursinus TaxID=34884 RepID=A0A3Q7PXM8_CALUR|nr:40S ribosomal protein S21 isoform X1 [Callorhinus ursinus]
MQNDAGEFVDLYVPRKCSASNRIIGAKDHASIQMNVAEVDKVTGRFNGQFKTYAICGAIRRMVSASRCTSRARRGREVCWPPAPSWKVSPMTPSSDWPRLTASFQRTSDWRRSRMWDICHK